MAEWAAFTGVLKAGATLVMYLNQVRAIKKHNPIIAQEIEHFIKSLNDNIGLLKEQLPNKKSWALESLETDLTAVTVYLDDNLKKGSFRQFWDAKQIKDKLERLRQDLINKFQLKLFVTTLEVTTDASKKMAGKMDYFGSRMVELSQNTRAETSEIRKLLRELLQPLAVGMERQDHRIQSLVAIVRQNEEKVETSSETQKFLADVLANLQEMAADEGSCSRPTQAEDDDDDYLDPFTAELLIDPVKCTDGLTYDRLTVFKNNLTQQKQLVILCDDESVRRRLFKRFREQDIERRFYGQRKSYRDEAFDLANAGHNAEALTMLKNVLQWAPKDKECLEKRDELQLHLDAKQKMVVEMSKLEEKKVVHRNLEKQKVMELSKPFQVVDSDPIRVVGRNLENGKGSTIPENSRAKSSMNLSHKGIGCHECLMYPIMGPRFSSKIRSDFDLCLSCFDKRVRTKQDFLRLDGPSVRKPKGSTIPENSNAKSSMNLSHKGIGCHECLMYPIMGPRFSSKIRSDFDLCLSCFDKRVRTKQDFLRLDGPSVRKPKGSTIPENSNAKSSMNLSHKGIGCHECLMYPIMGPRFSSKIRSDFDLCLSCFDKRGRTKQDFLRLDGPSVRKPKGRTIKEKSTAQTQTNVSHMGVTCDECSMNPINGPRFKSMVRLDYDLCLNCFEKHGRTKRDKQSFLRLDVPSASISPIQIEDSDEDSDEDSEEDSDEDSNEDSDEDSDEDI